MSGIIQEGPAPGAPIVCIIQVLWSAAAGAAAIRAVRVEDIQAAMSEMAQADVISALNTSAGMSSVEAFICSECGEGVTVIISVQ